MALTRPQHPTTDPSARDRSAVAATWTLHIETGDDGGTTRVLDLGTAPVRVGRGIHCEVRLAQVGLGDVQCTLRRRGDEWVVQPVGPPGRIWVDNRPTETQRVVPPGVALRVGRATLTIHETDPTRREPGSFAAPISLDAEPIAATPAPVALTSPEPAPEPEPDPDPISPPPPPVEPPATEATDDRVQRWQNRLDQRDQWLKDRQSEKRWEARWKAAGETLRARSAPPVATPPPAAPARPDPSPPPPPVRPLPRRTSVVRSSEPRPVFGHLKRGAAPERTSETPRVPLRPESGPPPPPPLASGPVAEAILPEPGSTAAPSVARPIPVVEPVTPSLIVASSLTDFADVDEVLADLRPDPEPRESPPPPIEAKLSTPGGTAANFLAPPTSPEVGATGPVPQPGPRDPHPTKQVEIPTEAVPRGVEIPDPWPPANSAAESPGSQPQADSAGATASPVPATFSAPASASRSHHSLGVASPEVIAPPSPLADEAPPPAPVKVARLKLHRRNSPPVGPPGPGPTDDRDAAEPQAVGPVVDAVDLRPAASPLGAVRRQSLASPKDAAPHSDPGRPSPAAEVAVPTARPAGLPPSGSKPAAAVPPPEPKEWPSARTIFAAQGTRATADGATTTTAEPARVRRLPEPTDPVRPLGWTIPLWLGWVPSASIVLALGGFAVGLAVLWLEDASSGNIAVRLATRSVAAHSPIIDPQTIPKAAWWQTTASHLAAWALTLERVGNGEDRTAEARALEADARSVSPLGARARFVSEPVPGQEADVAASIRLGPTRDVVTLTAMGHRLRRENQRADALRAYRTAFLTAATTPRSTLNRPDFRDDPQVNRYALPHASLLDGIAVNMAAAGDWTPEEWSEATPEFGPALLAVASALRGKDPGEADRRLEAICQAGSKPLAEAFEVAEHLAAIAEALAERKRWTDAVAQYRLAIDGETRDLDRRVWWFNLAEVARRSGDEPLRNQAIEFAKGTDLSDEVTQRAANAHRNAPEPNLSVRNR